MGKVALALGLLCCAGCNNLGYAYEVRISPAFSATEAEHVAGAVDGWTNAVDGRYLRLTLKSGDCEQHDAPSLVCVHRATEADVLSRYDFAPNIAGEKSGAVTQRSSELDSSDIYVAADVVEAKGADFAQVVGHELGHAFGLEHTGPGSIMCPDASKGSRVPTAVDADQYLSIRGQL